MPSLPYPGRCLSSPWQSQAHRLLLHQAFPDLHALTWQELSCLKDPYRVLGDTGAAAVWRGGKSCCSRWRKKELALPGDSEVILHLATEGQVRVCQGRGTGWGTGTAEVQGSEGWHVLGTAGKSVASWAVEEVKRPARKRRRSGGCQGGCLGVRQVPAVCRRNQWIQMLGSEEDWVEDEDGVSW